MQKEAQAELFIEDFNKFRASKNHTENIMKQEFIDLYEYTTQLQQIIQKEDRYDVEIPNVAGFLLHIADDIHYQTMFLQIRTSSIFLTHGFVHAFNH